MKSFFFFFVLQDVRDLHLTDCSGEHLMCLEASPGLHKLNLNSAANFIGKYTKTNLKYKNSFSLMSLSTNAAIIWIYHFNDFMDIILLSVEFVNCILNI